MLGDLAPDRRCDVRLGDLEGLRTVEVPAHLVDRAGGVPLEPVRVEALLTRGHQAGGAIVERIAVVDAFGFVARGLAPFPAVQDVVGPVEALDVLHDVDLADAGPRPPVGAVGAPEHPERGPVAPGLQARDVRHLEPALHVHHAVGRRLEVSPHGFDPRRRPGPGRVALRGDVQVAVADVDVAGIVGHCLDLAGTEVLRPAGVGRAEGQLPVGRVRQSAAGEVVPERDLPGGRGNGPWGMCDDQAGGDEGETHEEDERRERCGPLRHRVTFRCGRGRQPSLSARHSRDRKVALDESRRAPAGGIAYFRQIAIGEVHALRARARLFPRCSPPPRRRHCPAEPSSQGLRRRAVALRRSTPAGLRPARFRR